jgi:two-component system phosphate regulon response regulator OmpR
MADDDPHLLVVDDDSRLRTLLRKFLQENGFRVTLASDAEDARAKMQGLAFDLIVLDRMMPGESGVDFARRVRLSDNVPILMLTAMGEPEERIAGLQAGVDDYLPKPFEPRELLLRVQSILRRANGGERIQAPQNVKFGEFNFDLRKGELTRDGELVPLTTGEATLLRVFARSPGVTISRADLTRETGSAEGRAIDVQVTRLRRKIEADPKNPRYLQTVWGEGYVLWPD